MARHEQLTAFDSEEGNYAQHSALLRRPVGGQFRAPFDVKALKVLTFDELQTTLERWKINSLDDSHMYNDLDDTLRIINSALLEQPMTRALAAYHLHKWMGGKLADTGTMPCRVVLLQPPSAVGSKAQLSAAEEVLKQREALRTRSLGCGGAASTMHRVTHTLNAPQVSERMHGARACAVVSDRVMIMYPAQ